MTTTSTRPAPWDVTQDPRPDLMADHHLWARVLPAAWLLDPDRNMALGEGSSAFWSLEGFRCLGAQLCYEEGRLYLMPGAMDIDQYDADRERWLVPHRQEITTLFAGVAEDLAPLAPPAEIEQRGMFGA